jgi:hypothetical protein
MNAFNVLNEFITLRPKLALMIPTMIQALIIYVLMIAWLHNLFKLVACAILSQLRLYSLMP